MTYCTVRDVRNALTPDATNLPGERDTAASLADWQIDDAIQEAETILNSHVLPRYVVGTEDVEQIVVAADPEADPEVFEETDTVTVAKAPIRWWTRSIAAYYATLTFRKSKDIAEDDPVRLRYQAVMAHLRDVRDGRLDLPGFVPSESSSSGEVTVVNQYEGKMFDLDDFSLGYGGSSPQYVEPLRRW